MEIEIINIITQKACNLLKYLVLSDFFNFGKLDNIDLSFIYVMKIKILWLKNHLTQ